MRYLELNTSYYFVMSSAMLELMVENFSFTMLYRLAFNTARGYNMREDYLDHLREGCKDLHSVSEHLTNLQLGSSH